MTVASLVYMDGTGASEPHFPSTSDWIGLMRLVRQPASTQLHISATAMEFCARGERK